MDCDEALDRLDSTYHSPLLAIVRAEVERLRGALAELTDDRDELIQMGYEDERNRLQTRVAELERLLTHTGLLAAQDEHNALRHDIARHVSICASQAQEGEELRADLAAARARVAELEKGCDTITASAMASYKRAERAEADLAATRANTEVSVNAARLCATAKLDALRADLADARALLLEARGWLDPWESRQSALRDHITAALREGEK